MVVPPPIHFGYEQLVAVKEGCQLSAPSTGFRMIDVSSLFLGEHGPNSMEFPVLAKEMSTTEIGGWNVPDSQPAISLI